MTAATAVPITGGICGRCEEAEREERGFMFGLLSKLGAIHYTELDVDEILDKREMDSFDSEWVRVYQAVEDQKRDKTIDDTEDIREKAFMIVYQQSGCGELAGYISDDFGLIADSKLLNYSDMWLDQLIACYENAIIPCGKL